MSSWQSFFNQLSHPQKHSSLSLTETICNCKGGNLTQTADMNYQYSGICSSKCFCAIIEQDRREARKFDQSISITQADKDFNPEGVKTGKNALQHLFDNLKPTEDRD